MVDQANPNLQAATPPAQAANAPAATVQENKALRYSYSQLDPVHKNMADRLTVLINAYPDIVKLEDPKEQQDLINRIASSQSGREAKDVLDGATAAVKATFEKIRRQDPTGVLNAGKSASDAAGRVSDLADGASKGLDVALLPFNVPVAALGEMYNQTKVVWNGMDAKDAQKVATAYASTMQAQAVEREEKGFFGTLFSSFGGAWAVIKALFASTGDLIAEYIPATKEFMAKTFGSDPKRTLADNYARYFAENDVAVVRTEMQKLGTRDGIDFTAWGSALTGKSVLQNRAGQDQKLTPASVNSPVPTLAGAAKDKDGNPTVVPTDRGAVVTDALKKAGAAAKGEVDAAIGEEKLSPAAKAGIAVGTAYAADGMYGVAQGVARQVAGETRSGPAARAAAANAEADKFAKQAKAASEGKGLRFWESDAKRAERVATLEGKASAKAAEAATHEAAAATRAGFVPKKATGFVAAAEEAPKGHWVVRSGNYIGRFIGDGAGKLISKTIDAMPWVSKAAPVAGKVVGVGTLVVGSSFAAADVVNGKIEHDAKKAADGAGALATIAGDAAIGAAAGSLLGGVGAVPGAIVGAGVGSLVVLAGELFGFNGSGFKPYKETAQDVAEKQAYAQQKAQGSAQAKAFTNEELLAMDAGVKQQVQDMCSARSNKGVINFAFRSVDCTNIGALSSSQPPSTGGGRTVVAAQATPGVAGG